MNSLDNPQKPKWLDDLQQKSWEPEILLSGIVLYGMFQLPGLLDRFQFFFSTQVYSDINAMDLLIALLKVGVYWLTIGLILHLVCRGLWVGLIGLSYSYPEGIRTNQLKFRPRYMKRIKTIPSLEVLIIKLEDICSNLYSISFLLFLSLTGIYIFLIVLIVIPMVLVMVFIDSLANHKELMEGMNIYSSWVFYFGALGVIDFLTLGYFRRFKVIGYLYYPFYLLFSYLSLARFYRSTYYILVTNYNRWKLFLFFLIFFIISFFGVISIHFSSPALFFSRIDVWGTSSKTIAYEGYYQDKERERYSTVVQIPSDIMNGDVLKVFVPSSIELEDSLKKFIDYEAIVNMPADSVEEDELLIKGVSTFYQLTIADSTFAPKMYFQKQEKTGQRGYLTYLNIGYLKEGLYELIISGPKGMYDDPFAIVPFYKTD